MTRVISAFAPQQGPSLAGIDKFRDDQNVKIDSVLLLGHGGNGNGCVRILRCSFYSVHQRNQRVWTEQ